MSPFSNTITLDIFPSNLFTCISFAFNYSGRALSRGAFFFSSCDISKTLLHNLYTYHFSRVPSSHPVDTRELTSQLLVLDFCFIVGHFAYLGLFGTSKHLALNKFMCSS